MEKFKIAVIENEKELTAFPGSDSLRTRLLATVSASQDGNPLKSLREEMNTGRLIPVSDNLNRLLADAVNSAVSEGDPSQMLSDVEYCIQQLEAARAAIAQRFC